ncbi:MAG: hypothetical protein ACOCRX_10315 [Candidatus Woesearchaeota archaeon]
MVKFYSTNNEYLFLGYKQLPEFEIKNWRELNGGIQFRKGVYETEDEREIHSLRLFIDGFKKMLPYVREEGKEIEGDRKTFEEIALERQKEQERDKKEREQKEKKINEIKELFS